MYANPCDQLGIYVAPTGGGFDGGFSGGGFDFSVTGGGGGFTPGSGPGGFQYPGGFQSPLTLFGIDLGNLGLPDGVADWISFGIDTWRRFSDHLSPEIPWSGNYDNNPLSPVCNGTPDFGAVQRAMGRIPDADVLWITQTLRDGNDGNGPSTRGELQNPATLPYWVKALMGGTDCVNSRFPEAPRRLTELVAEYGAPSAIEGALGGGMSTGLLVAAAAALFLFTR